MVIKQKCLIFLCILLLVFSAASAAARPNELPGSDESSPTSKQRILVLFSGDARPDLVEKYGQVTHKFSLVNGVAAEVGEDAIGLLKGEHSIRKVDPDIKVYAFPMEKRPVLSGDGQSARSLRSQQVSSSLEIKSVAPRWNLEAEGVNVIGAWNKSLDGSGVKIAILDTGVNYNLDDLDDYYLGGYDFVNNDDNPKDDNDHGTFVASVAVGEGFKKIVGTAPHASHYALKVLDRKGEGYVSDIIEAIEWAVSNDADVISMSLGGYGSPEDFQTFEEAVNNAYDAGLTLVAASGNEGYEYPAYPAAFQNVVSVGAHAQDQAIPSFSNWGVDLVAPGVDVVAMDGKGILWYVSGTSIATPHVSASIALEEQYSNLEAQGHGNSYFWQTLKQAALDLGFAEEMQGSGKADIDYAINLMANNWFVDYVVSYLDYVYINWQGYPAYYIGRNMHYQVNITNNQDRPIHDLKVVATQAYYNHQGEAALPGDPAEEFTVSLNPGETVTLDDYYYIPYGSYPGLDRTEVTLQASSYPLATIFTDPYAGIWCPPAA